jgi:hypothetical protein
VRIAAKRYNVRAPTLLKLYLFGGGLCTFSLREVLLFCFITCLYEIREWA